jgi:fibronectin-binding autotransporter adhesin
MITSMKMIVPFSPKGFEMRLAFRSVLLTHVLASSFFLGTLASAGWAQSYTWSGLAGGTWDTSNTNWSSAPTDPWDVTNGPTNTAIFNTASLVAPVSGTVYTNGITFNTSGILGGSGTINLAGSTPTITSAANVTGTIDTIIAGSNGLTKNGDGILRLGGNSGGLDAAGTSQSGVNTYTGLTKIMSGEIDLRKASGLGAAGAGNGTEVVGNGATLRIRAVTNGNTVNIGEDLTIAGTGTAATQGAIRNQTGNTTLSGNLTLSGNAAIWSQSSSQLIISNNITTAGNTLTLNGAGITTINGSIIGSSSSGLTLIGGSSTVNLNAANTHGGTTTLTNGTLALGNVNALQNSTLDTGTVNTRAVTFTVAGTNTYNLGGLSGGLAINIGANTLSVGANNANTSTVGVLTGTGGLTKVGNGTLTLGGNQNYEGATNVNAGTLELNGGSIKAQSTVNVGTAGTLTGGGTISGNATLTGNGIISLGDATIGGTLAVTGGNWNGLGTVTGAVTSSSGTFNIGSGANLTANGGLNVTGGTIAGTGTITGPTLFSGGALAPGNSIGILNNVGNVTWNGNGANWIFEIGAGNTSDLLNITGNFNKGSSGTFTFDFGGSTEIGTFKLVDWSSGTTFAVSDFSYVGLGGGNTGSFAFGGDGSQLNFTITAVPEPTSMVLVSLVGVAGVAIRARRRKMRFEV